MRLYEGMFIISDTVANSDWDSTVTHVEGLLKNRGAEIVRSEKWEERKFAYKLKGHKRGTYLLVYFNAAPDSISLIKRDFELSDQVLRTLIVKTDKIKDSDAEEDTKKPVEEVEVTNVVGTDTVSDEKEPSPVTVE